jgi:putative endonuclease
MFESSTQKVLINNLIIYCGVEQLVARWAHNPKAVCSSHTPATRKSFSLTRKAFFNLIFTPMFTVYALYSKAFDKIYIGMTSDLEKRFFAHNNLPKGWTKHFRPWELVHTEIFDSKQEAMAREKQLKSARGRIYVRTLI